MRINPTTATGRSLAAHLRLPRRLATSTLTYAWLLPTLLFGVGLALRLYHLNAQSLWLDEGSTWAEVTGRSGKGWPALLAELLSPKAAYPLYHLLLRAWIAIAGDNEWALRFPSALTGALSVVAIYLAAGELTRDPRPGDWETALQARRPQTADRRLVQLGRKSPLGISSVAPRYRGVKLRAYFLPISAALLLLASPFALWYAQEVKTYSLLLLTTTLQLWALLCALRLNTRRAWLLYLGLAGLSFFVHRLALLTLAGGALAYLITWPDRGHERRLPGSPALGRLLGPSRHPITPSSRLLLGLGVVLLAGLAIWGTHTAIGSESSAAGGHIPAGPLTALWLTLGRLSLDRSPGSLAQFFGLPGLGPLAPFPSWLGWLHADLSALIGHETLAAPEFPRLWLLPTLLLLGWGLARLVRAARSGDRAAVGLLCSGLFPLLLFSISTALTRLYEPRYMMVVLPAWALTLTFPLKRNAQNAERSRVQHSVFGVLLALVLLTHIAALLQPIKGLFSGDPVKEQWRQAISELAHRAQPDDLVILHPYYVRPLWDYYAPRVTADPLPQPVIFPIFGEGFRGADPSREQAREFVRQHYEPFYDQAAKGKDRALLLVAPEHARTVDPPKTLDELIAEARAAGKTKLPTQPDEYGWLGLRFEFPQRTWPCGGEKYIGVHLMCQSYPEAFGTGAPPQPATSLGAIFGDTMRLRGFTLKPTTGDGSFRPGGTLAVTLYWEASRQPTADYTMFLHLCRDCEAPPVASNDAPPLFGYPPAGRTTTWRIGDPVHDERTLALPADLPPGRYSLLLGVYPLGNPAIGARLSVREAPALSAGRVLLAQVDVQ